MSRSRADPIKQTGEIRVTIPWVRLEMDYEVLGQLLVIPLRSIGHFDGNFSEYFFSFSNWSFIGFF